MMKGTPGAALAVEMTISGDLTAGPFGTDPDKWKRTEARVESGQILVDVFGRAAGVNTPELHIRWKDENGNTRLESLEIPFP
jgi:hypothetical protein